MNRLWQLQEAKNKFGEVVGEALSQGPQIATRRGGDTGDSNENDFEHAGVQSVTPWKD